MNQVSPPVCPGYSFGCECSECVNLEVWGKTQGLLANPYRAAAKAKLAGLGITTSSLLPDHWTMSFESPESKALPPMNCKCCNFRNEYVGPEHLVNGVYVCRTCKPSYRPKAEA